MQALNLQNLCCISLIVILRNVLIMDFIFFYIAGINTKHLANALQLQTIDVIKDFNLENGDGKDDPELKHLELFHLVIYLKLQKNGVL